MEMQAFRKELIEDAKSSAAADGGGTPAAYVGAVARHLVEAEVLPDFTPAFYLGETRRKGRMRVDGYALDDFDLTMNLVAVSFSGSEEPETLTRTDAEQLFEWLTRFVEEVYSYNLHQRIEESTPAADLVETLRTQRERIKKLRLLLLTDRVMSGRIESLPFKDVCGFATEFQIWDVNRLYRVCQPDTVREPIAINFTEYVPGGLPCLDASAAVADAPYKSYLSVIPGTVLADVYDRYGAQLLEGNVRSFLSTKVAVNKKIRETILTKPDRFFAFNNGISATASEVVVKTSAEGRSIAEVRDFQIINGGQTTASLSNARHRDKADLRKTYVQMKLTVIAANQEESQKTVQEIARSSNSQNKVSDADFFSTHPFHVRMEQASRRIFAPGAAGAQHDTHWFYERARGQYLQAQMRMSDADRRRFATQNPKEQLITKTDLAKVRNSWSGFPQIVSRGAQNNFAHFAEQIGDGWAASDASFNDRYFQESVALVILFRHLEYLIPKQPWYQQGYRANIVTYTLALLAHLISKQYPKQILNLFAIWTRQTVPDSVTRQLLVLANAVHDSITDPTRGQANVTQWCKQEACWNRIKALKISLVDLDSSVLVSKEDARSEKEGARKERKIDAGIEAQTEVLGLEADFWQRLQRFALQRGLASPNDQAALKIACRIPQTIPNPLQSQWLLALLERAKVEGFSVDKAS